MSFHSELIKWYKKNKRVLPFRELKNTYTIWLSEVILQQTRVEQGLPYYHRFVEHYPNIFALASADEEEVLKLWQGLGYYSRGRNLLATAREVVKKYNGVFPDNYHELLKLKGIGPYTAAAIASFAYNKPMFVVDGNVSRVLARLFEVKEPVNTANGKKVIEQLAAECGDRKHPALYNYAMMELGALICTPANPLCHECPVQAFCIAYAHQTQKFIPYKIKNRKVTHRWFYYLLLLSDDKIYIRQRTQNDIWKNLYELPLIETSKKMTAKEIKEKLTHCGIVEYRGTKPYIHLLSHQKIEARFIISTLKKKVSKKQDEKYFRVSISEFQKRYAHPRLIEKFLNDFLNEKN